MCQLCHINLNNADVTQSSGRAKQSYCSYVYEKNEKLH